MKRNAIARIVIWSVLIVTLVGILIYSIKNQENMQFKFFNISINESVVCKYDNADSYSIGSDTTHSDIENIDIEWINGEVNVVPYNDSVIKIEETSDEELIPEYKLRWKTENGTLTIKPSESEAKAKIFPKKRLTVYIPEKMAKSMSTTKFDIMTATLNVSDFCLQEIVAETISGDVAVSDCKIDNLTLDSTSGDLKADNCYIGIASFDSTSGKITVTGVVSQINVDSTSGGILISTDTVPKSIKASSTSGNVRVELSENDGFTLDYDTTTGKLYNDFETKTSNEQIIYGNGVNKYTVDTTSANLHIKKK